MLRTLGQVAAAIWEVDPTVPLFLNGLGQDYSNKYTQCGRAYPGMHWVSGWWCVCMLPEGQPTMMPGCHLVLGQGRGGALSLLTCEPWTWSLLLTSFATNSVCWCVCSLAVWVQGDGFITNSKAVEAWGISTPSDMFSTPLTEWVGPSVRVEQGAAQVRSEGLDGAAECCPHEPDATNAGGCLLIPSLCVSLSVACVVGANGPLLKVYGCSAHSS